MVESWKRVRRRKLVVHTQVLSGLILKMTVLLAEMEGSDVLVAVMRGACGRLSGC